MVDHCVTMVTHGGRNSTTVIPWSTMFGHGHTFWQWSTMGDHGSLIDFTMVFDGPP